MKLWSREQSVDALVEQFTVGQDPVLDLQLARFDLQGTMAHIKMLCRIGLLSETELSQLEEALKGINRQVEEGLFAIEPGVEDVHSQVEIMLTRQLGEVGKKIHSGRSRNDQVLVDLRLFFRSEIRELALLAGELFEMLMRRSEESRDLLMPGYTHTQVAMVSSFGLWFSAWAETLADDLQLLQSVYAIINRNPLGSAAGYGSSFPLDRQMTTELLGFSDLNYNAIHAQLGRGKTEQYLSFAVAGISATLGRLAADVCLFTSQNFNFLRLPDAFTTGSSIMPHKKNPDVFELIRARCNRLQTLPQQVSAVTGNLMSGYHRDFQLLKEIIFPALSDLKSCLKLSALSLEGITLNADVLSDGKYSYLYTVEVVNELVLKGLPFRDAYQEVSRRVAAGEFEFGGSIQHSHAGSIGNLCLPQIWKKLELTLAAFDFEGSIGKAEVLLKQ